MTDDREREASFLFCLTDEHKRLAAAAMRLPLRDRTKLQQIEDKLLVRRFEKVKRRCRRYVDAFRECVDRLEELA